MGARCDYRTLARQQANTERETNVVNELLTRKWVAVDYSGNNGERIGYAGLAWSSWRHLKHRLEQAGFRFVNQSFGTNQRAHFKIIYPGEE